MKPEAKLIYEHIGKMVSIHRKAAGLSQADLATMLGISRSSLANIEAGRQSVLVHHVYAIAGALGCLPRDLAPKPRVRVRCGALPDDDQREVETQ